ncbi:hypothetical protein ABTY98_40605 [Streptomyces sp. NPDC096040]|uniref:hypothetical protein n=1 Tax=Streptomyces sp. NPDC096040 TaxID=3155541 RepID=UPI00332DAD8D
MSTSDVPRGSATSTRPAGPLRSDLLGIYLNDHLAGATIGTRRARNVAAATRGTPLGDVLEPIAEEIEQDRASLLEIMGRLGVPARRYKVLAAGTAEWAGRFKPNGRIIGRSPLTTVVELEFLRLGVEGKAAGWRTLRTLADTDGRLDHRQLDELLARAERQLSTLEELRLRKAREVFRGRT